MDLKLHVLLVDVHSGGAENSIEQLLAHSFAVRYTLTRGNSLEEAMKVLQADQVDVVLLDLGPAAGAIDLRSVDRVLKTMPTIPVFVLAEQEDKQAALEAVEA